MKKTLLLIGVVLLCSFYVFSRQVKRGFLRNVDFAVTVKIQDRLSSKLRIDGILEDAGFLASPLVASASTIIISAWAFVVITSKKKKVLVSIVILAGFFLLTLGEVYGKSVVHHPAPPFFMIKHPTSIFPTYYINEEYSYPSGHTARAMYLVLAATGVMHQVSRNKAKAFIIVGILYIGIIGLSRIYLGHHWLSDVIGGFLLGNGLGTAVLAFL